MQQHMAKDDHDAKPAPGRNFLLLSSFNIENSHFDITRFICRCGFILVKRYSFISIASADFAAYLLSL